MKVKTKGLREDAQPCEVASRGQCVRSDTPPRPVIFFRRNLVVSLSFVNPELTKSNIIIRNILHEAVEEEEYERQ